MIRVSIGHNRSRKECVLFCLSATYYTMRHALSLLRNTELQRSELSAQDTYHILGKQLSDLISFLYSVSTNTDCGVIDCVSASVSTRT